jgi:hypothetical protein
MNNAIERLRDHLFQDWKKEQPEYVQYIVPALSSIGYRDINAQPSGGCAWCFGCTDKILPNVWGIYHVQLMPEFLERFPHGRERFEGIRIVLCNECRPHYKISVMREGIEGVFIERAEDLERLSEYFLKAIEHRGSYPDPKDHINTNPTLRENWSVIEQEKQRLLAELKAVEAQRSPFSPDTLCTSLSAEDQLNPAHDLFYPTSKSGRYFCHRCKSLQKHYEKTDDDDGEQIVCCAHCDRVNHERTYLLHTKEVLIGVFVPQPDRPGTVALHITNRFHKT